MNNTKFVSKYKETVSDMNREYTNVLWHYKIKDCRAEYLNTFEQALALNLDFPLWENPRYFRISTKYPLPDEGYVSIRKYKLYLMLYGYVMRDAGLLHRDTGEDDEDSELGSRLVR